MKGVKREIIKADIDQERETDEGGSGRREGKGVNGSDPLHRGYALGNLDKHSRNIVSVRATTRFLLIRSNVADLCKRQTSGSRFLRADEDSEESRPGNARDEKLPERTVVFDRFNLKERKRKRKKGKGARGSMSGIISRG